MINSNIDNLLEEALSKLTKHDISGALYILEEASKIAADKIELLNLKADCFYLLGDFFQAKQNWDEVLQIEPSNKIARSKLEKFNSPAFQFWVKRYYQAIDLIEQKDFLTAQGYLQKLIKENDNFISLYQLLGLTYLALNDEKNALKVWKQGLKLDQNNPELIRYIHTPKKGIRKAKFGISKAEEPEHGPKSNILLIVSGMFIMLLLLQMSFSLNSKQDYKNTIQNLQAKIVDLSAEINRAQPVIAHSNNDAQIPEENAKVALLPEGSHYDVGQEKEYYRKGYQAYLAQDYKTAISNLSVVVAISSQSYINREALYYLALSHYTYENYDEAKDYYFQYLEEFPNTNYTDESLYYLGCIYYYAGDLDNARIMMEELNKFDPGSCYKHSIIYNEIME